MKQRSKNMSTLTSLVKNGKRKIIKTKTEEPQKREQKSVQAQQKLPDGTGSSASKRGFLGRPDPSASRGFLGRPDPSASRGFLGRPDPSASQDPTRPQ
jgi:hypothetical protein